MRLNPLVAVAVLAGTAAARPASSDRLDKFINGERDIALENIFRNIGDEGTEVPGAAPGVIVASPSKDDPDYVFTWTRDAALTVKALLEQLHVKGSKEDNDRILQIAREYAEAQAILQNVENPSGDISDLQGLGEPKFEVNLTAFTGSWGRPQRDGPPLRATALIQYAHTLGKRDSDYIKHTLWPVIKNDLDYTARYWNQTGFDLWEEVSASSFFTFAASHRALVEGAAFAHSVQANSSGFMEQAANALCFLQSFWNGERIIANINPDSPTFSRGGLDIQTIIASVHNFDIEAGCDSKTFQPCSDHALANHKAVVDSFRDIYTINEGIASDSAVNLGRYEEDVYYNGNPWYLATLAAAEQLYQALLTWEKQQSLEITSTSLAFFQHLYPSAAVGSFKKSSKEYKSITKAVRTYADGFVALVEEYTPADGALAEQYLKNNGTPISAGDLTWSYAAFLTATAARDGAVPSSWGAAVLAAPGSPGTCSPGPPAPTGNVTFNLQDNTQAGEFLTLVGSLGALAQWTPERALNLTRGESSGDLTQWSITVALPANRAFGYKYIRKFAGNDSYVWASDPNYSSRSPTDGQTVTIDDTWR